MALFSPEGELMFANSSMRSAAAVAGRRRERLGSGGGPAAGRQPGAAAGRARRSPAAARRARCRSPWARTRSRIAEPAERLLMCHAIEDTNGRFLGVMLVARNLGFLSHVHSTLNYSRKLAALGRLMAGVAHEVKNPLNAMTIHLELLKQKLAALPQPIVVPDGVGRHAPDRSGQARHGDRRRDPPPRSRRGRVPEVRAARGAAAPAGAARLDHQRGGLDVGAGSGAARGDRPRGVLGEPARDQRGSGHAPAGRAQPRAQRLPGDAQRRHAEAVLPGRRRAGGSRSTSRTPASAFRPRTSAGSSTSISRPRTTGTGIGLSMVYRIVQLHDGEVEVESTPGRGTRFRLVFPQA